jgi:hypothetical protein
MLHAAPDCGERLVDLCGLGELPRHFELAQGQGMAHLTLTIWIRMEAVNRLDVKILQMCLTNHQNAELLT